MFRIETISAFVSVDELDEEGIIGELVRGQWMPFIAADEDRLRSLRPRAELLARASGRPVRLVRFSVREDLETIEP